MKRTLLLLAFFLCSSCTTLHNKGIIDKNSKVEVTGCEIIDYGILDKKGTKVKERTTTIYLEVGTTFGFLYKIKGKPKGEMINLTIQVILPVKEFNSESIILFEIINRKTSKPIDQLSTYGVTFDRVDRDTPCGKWRIQIIYKGKVLTEKIFIVKCPKFVEVKGVPHTPFFVDSYKILTILSAALPSNHCPPLTNGIF